MPRNWTGQSFAKPGDKGRLAPGRVARDIAAGLRAVSQVAAAPNMGTMGGTSIQDDTGTYHFLCGRSKCGGPDTCGP